MKGCRGWARRLLRSYLVCERNWRKMKSRAWFKTFLPHSLKSVALGKYRSLDFSHCKMRNCYAVSYITEPCRCSNHTPWKTSAEHKVIVSKNLLSLSSSQKASVLFRRPKTDISAYSELPKSNPCLSSLLRNSSQPLALPFAQCTWCPTWTKLMFALTGTIVSGHP